MIRAMSYGCALALAAGTAAGQVSLNSIDTFDADNEGWRVGNAGVDPTFNGGTSFNGQPGFLRHFSDDSGSNGRFIMWTQQDDWTGDYVGAGVDGVSLWADVRSGDDTTFWLGFDGPGGWFFTPGQQLVADADWERFDFGIAPGDLIYAAGSGGTQNAADTLSAVTRFEIFAGDGPVEFRSNGDLLRASRSENVIWFDNIAAVPSPGAAGVLAVLGVAGFMRRR